MPTIIHTVTVVPLDASFSVQKDATLLQALEAAGLDAPSSCRNGTCRTCICRLQAGTVAYAIEWTDLSFDEQREGYILPCVALARSDLVVDMPLARRVQFD